MTDNPHWDQIIDKLSSLSFLRRASLCIVLVLSAVVALWLTINIPSGTRIKIGPFEIDRTQIPSRFDKTPVVPKTSIQAIFDPTHQIVRLEDYFRLTKHDFRTFPTSRVAIPQNVLTRDWEVLYNPILETVNLQDIPLLHFVEQTLTPTPPHRFDSTGHARMCFAHKKQSLVEITRTSKIDGIRVDLGFEGLVGDSFVKLKDSFRSTVRQYLPYVPNRYAAYARTINNLIDSENGKKILDQTFANVQEVLEDIVRTKMERGMPLTKNLRTFVCFEVVSNDFLKSLYPKPLLPFDPLEAAIIYGDTNFYTGTPRDVIISNGVTVNGGRISFWSISGAIHVTNPLLKNVYKSDRTLYTYGMGVVARSRTMIISSMITKPDEFPATLEFLKNVKIMLDDF
jgi:hypothetical protein